MKEYLFVYGSLRRPNELRGEIRDLIDTFHYCGAAQVRGTLYDFGDYCGGVLDGSGGGTIHGDLLELPVGASVFEILDRYEDIDSLNPESSLFARRRTQVFLEDGNATEAWIYVYNRSAQNAAVIESGDYLKFKAGS